MYSSTDDSAAHISEEVAGAARAAPIAILVGVGATASLGWLLLIATSFVIPSIPDLLATDLPLPMGQVFLDVLGKQGMLAIWSLIIVVQVCMEYAVLCLFSHTGPSTSQERHKAWMRLVWSSHSQGLETSFFQSYFT